MTFNDLPKQQRLLIYMFYYEAESGKAITMLKNGDDILAYGISKNKNSLANMLYILCKKGFVTKAILRNGEVAYHLTSDGEVAYCLTAAGQDSARHSINLYSNDIEVPETEDSLRKTEKKCCDIEAYAKRLEQIIVGLKDELFKLNDQPKQFDGLVKAQAKEIERLKAALKNAEAENDNLRVSKQMVRDAAEYFDEEKTKLRNERDSLQKSLYSIDIRRKALAKENEDLSIKILALKKSLLSASADIAKKNKRIEHLEDSIDKLKCSLR